MFGANVTMKTLKNVNTGIDITVPTIQEVEAPLGGTSTEYEISILTTLDLYKSHLHSKDDVIHFCVFRAYKEVEDFHDKVVKKFSDVAIPSMPKGRSVAKCSVEEKRSFLNRFMEEVSHHKNIIESSLFFQFLGILKHRKSRSSISETFSEVPLGESGVSSPRSANQNSQVSNQIEENPSISNNTVKVSTVDAGDKKDEAETDDQMISELFPKMKVRKSSRVGSVDEGDNVKDEFQPSLQSEIEQAKKISMDDDLDLFEEIEKIKEEEKKETKRIDSNRLPHQGLFDGFGDPSSLLFSPSTVQSSRDKLLFDSSEVVSNTTNNKTLSTALKKDAPDEVATDLFKFVPEERSSKATLPKQEAARDPFIVNRLFQDGTELDMVKRIPGEVSLFEEQDFGTSISKDDEALFLVPKVDKATIVNTLLSSACDDVSDDGVTETLEELITLPEPSVQLPKPESIPAVEEVWKLPPKPVPKPRNKLNISCEAKEKPYVLPRKVFPAKPTLPPKPMLPPKPLDTAQKQPEDITVHLTGNKENDSVENLSKLDILQYIEQEEKIANAHTGLFD